MSIVREIAVRSANGDELVVYEFEDRRFLSKVRRHKLCTGETVVQLDRQTFVITGNGELLARV